MGTNNASADKQSWNDQFEAFMVKPTSGKGALKKVEEDNADTNVDGNEEEKVSKDGENESTMVDDKRLFVMNLSYQVTKEEVEALFGKYGEIVDVEIPFRKHGKGVPLGLGFVRFTTSEGAIQAFAELDKTYFQGRKLHIKPAEKKPPPPVEEQPFYKDPSYWENQPAEHQNAEN